MQPSRSPAAYLTRVAATATRITEVEDLASLVREVVVAVQGTPGHDLVSVLLVDEETNELVTIAACGAGLEAHVGRTRPITQVRDGGLAGWVAYHRRSAQSTDPGVRSELAVPLLLGDSVIGVIDVVSTAVGGLDEWDRLQLEALAAQAAVVIENVRLREDLAKTRRELQEEERERIAHDLHDGLMQTLLGALYQLDSARLRAECSSGASTEALQRLRALIVDCVDEMDCIVHRRRPLTLDDRGLTAALEHFANDISREGDEIEIEVESPMRPLDPVVETAVYRIVQEALANAVKHSRAERVRVRLDQLPTRLAVTVSDNGVGFRNVPDDGRGVGLLSIQERARGVGARLDVRSAPGRGTTLSLDVPLDDSHERLAAGACHA
jgi:signal transduction histidine kinase